MAEKISGVYKITNTVTGDFYIGSSKDVKSRWKNHKKPSIWNKYPNKQLYQDMKRYGTDKFVFEVIEEVEIDSLKEKEQYFIETLKPTYNQMNAKGLNIARYKEYNKEYKKSDKYKDYQKEYHKTDKYKKAQKQSQKEYNNQICYYNGETLTLSALRTRFLRQGLSNPTAEAKKYLLNEPKDNIKESQKESQKEYHKIDKCKKAQKEYNNQLCCYNGEVLTLCALSKRFSRAGIPHPQIEAKKYLLKQ